MLVDPQAFDDFLLATLRPVVAPIPVESFPDSVEDYVATELKSALGVVLSLIGSMDKVESSEDGGEFQFNPQFSIVIPNLRADEGHESVYGVAKLIADTFNEKRFTIDSEPFFFEVLSIDFVDRIDNQYWQYIAQLQCTPILALRNL